MAVREGDSFAHYTSFPNKGWSAVNGSPSISAGNGRYGKDCLRLGQNVAIRRPFPANLTTFIVGLPRRNSAIGSGSSLVAAFADNNQIQVAIWQRSDTKVELRLGGTINPDNTSAFMSGSTLLQVSDQPTQDNNFQTWEIKCTIDNTTGLVQVQVDGDLLIDYSGDTQVSANAYATGMAMYEGANASRNIDHDHYLLLDDVAGPDGAHPNDDFIGDCRIGAIFPSGAGATTDWTPDSGSNYARVDENPYDDDTSYVQSSTVGNKDTYVYDDVPATFTDIVGCLVNMRAKRTDASTRSIAAVARSNGAEADSSDCALSDSYAYYQRVFEVDPDTGDQWTEAAVNAAEFGQKVTA